jgi:2'-5' RNA ligase superfamily
MLAWHVLPGGRLDGLAAALAPALDRPGLTAVPPEWLHLTMRGVGRASGYDPEARARLAAEAVERLTEVEPVQTVVGPARVVEEGVAADVVPTEPLARVHALLPGMHAEPFWPHVTFAYAHTTGMELEPLAEALSAPLRVDAVSLILLRREARAYRWDVLASVPLGQGAGRGGTG